MSFIEKISPEVSKYVLWEDPMKSAAVLGGATLVYVSLERMNYNIINIASNVAMVSVLVLALWTQAAAFMPNRAPPATAPKLQVTEAQLRGIVEKTIGQVNWLLENLYAVGVSKDKVLILKVVAGLYLAAQVASLFHLLTLVYMTLCVAFVWPLVYRKFKTEIDQACGEANKQFEQIKVQVLEKVAKGGKAVSEKKEE